MGKSALSFTLAPLFYFPFVTIHSLDHHDTLRLLDDEKNYDEERKRERGKSFLTTKSRYLTFSLTWEDDYSAIFFCQTKFAEVIRWISNLHVLLTNLHLSVIVWCRRRSNKVRKRNKECMWIFQCGEKEIWLEQIDREGYQSCIWEQWRIRMLIVICFFSFVSRTLLFLSHQESSHNGIKQQWKPDNGCWESNQAAE